MPFWIGGGASTVCTPLALRSATAAPSVSSVASPQVRCATAEMSNSSCTMAATTAVARLLPLPPAEYVDADEVGGKRGQLRHDRAGRAQREVAFRREYLERKRAGACREYVGYGDHDAIIRQTKGPASPERGKRGKETSVERPARGEARKRGRGSSCRPARKGCRAKRRASANAPCSRAACPWARTSPRRQKRPAGTRRWPPTPTPPPRARPRR